MACSTESTASRALPTSGYVASPRTRRLARGRHARKRVCWRPEPPLLCIRLAERDCREELPAQDLIDFFAILVCRRAL